MYQHKTNRRYYYVVVWADGIEDKARYGSVNSALGRNSGRKWWYATRTEYYVAESLA